MAHRVISLLIVSAATACGGKSPSPPTTATTETATTAAAGKPIVALTADGKALAEGEWLACTDGSGKAIEIHDGEFEYNGGQASVGGKYELAPGKVLLKPSDPDKWAGLTDNAAPDLVAAADLSTVGGMACKKVGG